MWRLHEGLATLILWGALLLTSLGQSLPDGLAPDWDSTAPEFGIRDEGGFFKKHSGAAKRISDKLRKLEVDHRFRILLMVEPVLIATTAPQMAVQLQQSWLPEGGGLVVVYEADNRRLGFGSDVSGGPDDQEIMGLVPAHETVAIVRRAKDAADLGLAPEAYIEGLMGNLVAEFESYFAQRAAPLPAGRSLRLGLLTVGALTLLALFAIIVGSLTKLPSVAGARSYHFPAVNCPERLGAPSGGGSVTTRRFGPSPRG